MKLRNGMRFEDAKPGVVIDYLRNLSVKKLEVKSQNLSLCAEGEDILLKTADNIYPVRESFFYKLLKWYAFPLKQLYRLSTESLVSIGNDFLINIDKRVNIVLENGEAVSITSLEYSELNDLKVFDLLKGIKIQSVSRNDFCTRISVHEKFDIEPFPGDDFGVGAVIYNSQTGFRALSVYTFLLRYICSNGAVIRIPGKAERLIHYGTKEDEFTDLINNKLDFLEKEKDKIVRSLRALREGNPEKEQLQKLRTRVSGIIGRTKSKDLFEEYESNGRNTYDLFNMITSEANRHSFAAKAQLQELAGALMTGIREFNNKSGSNTWLAYNSDFPFHQFS